MVTWPLGVLQALAQPGWGLTLFVLGSLALGYSVVVYNVAQVGHLPRPSARADEREHPVSSCGARCRWAGCSEDCSASGSASGGALAVGLVGCALAVGWVLASPLRRMRDLPVDATPG